MSSQLIDDNILIFDPGDRLNGSLYLCLPAGTDPTGADGTIDDMRAAGLWSLQPASQVQDHQRDAYKAQLVFKEAVAFSEAGAETFMIARFDHERFPSDDERWNAWKEFFDARYRRLPPAD